MMGTVREDSLPSSNGHKKLGMATARILQGAFQQDQTFTCRSHGDNAPKEKFKRHCLFCGGGKAELEFITSFNDFTGGGILNHNKGFLSHSIVN